MYMWLMLVSLVSNTFPTTHLNHSSQPLSSQVPSCTITTGLLKQAGVVHVAHIGVPCQHHLPNNSATLFPSSLLHRVPLIKKADDVHVVYIGVSGQHHPPSPIHPTNPHNHSPRKFPLAQGRQGEAWWRSTCGPCWCPWSASPSM